MTTGAAKCGFTALEQGLVSCHHCSLLCQDQHGHGSGHDSEVELLCPRCGAPLHARKPNSLARTWALMIAAGIMFVPAMVYPIMTFRALGRGEPQTIMQGVEFLVHKGEYAIAFVIFFASIMVPAFKFVILAFLLISVHGRWSWRPRDRTSLYRLLEVVGRWSMIDVFVVAILVSLVQLGSLASVEPGFGAAAFGSVVVLTMFASMAFDPRLIWDVMDESDS